MTATVIIIGTSPKKFMKLAEHPAICTIENIDMDEGRFFVHLKGEYQYAPNGYGQIHTMSFGSVAEARRELAKVEKKCD